MPEMRNKYKKIWEKKAIHMNEGKEILITHRKESQKFVINIKVSF